MRCIGYETQKKIDHSIAWYYVCYRTGTIQLCRLYCIPIADKVEYTPAPLFPVPTYSPAIYVIVFQD